MAAALLLVVLTGVIQFWMVSGSLNGSWLASSRGVWLTIGSLAGIAAYAYGLAVSRPTALRIAELTRQIGAAGGPPSPQLLIALQGQQVRLSWAGVVSAVLLVVTVVGMVIA